MSLRSHGILLLEGTASCPAPDNQAEYTCCDLSFSSRYRVFVQSARMLQQLKSPGLGYNEFMPRQALNETNEQGPPSSHEFFCFTNASGRLPSKLEDEQDQLKVGPRENFLLDVAAQHRRGCESGSRPSNPRSAKRPRLIQCSQCSERSP